MIGMHQEIERNAKNNDHVIRKITLIRNLINSDEERNPNDSHKCGYVNSRIYKSNLRMRLYSRLLISSIYKCVLIKYGYIATLINVK